MARFYFDFDKWCREATKRIKYRPDRQAVYEELYLHLQDRYEDFRERNIEHEVAVQKTLQAMGDAKELAPMLAEIHRPFWGYMYSLCKWVFFLTLLFVMMKFVPWRAGLDISDHNTIFNGEYDVYAESYHENEYSTWERILYDEPDVSTTSDGYTFSIKRVALWKKTPKSSTDTHSYWRDENMLWIEMTVTNPRPWEPLINHDALYWFHAKDSLGNYYYSFNESTYTDVPTIRGDIHRTGLCTLTYSMYTWNYVSMDAEWIELHYDRSGRNITLRIDLTKGEYHEN